MRTNVASSPKAVTAAARMTSRETGARRTFGTYRNYRCGVPASSTAGSSVLHRPTYGPGRGAGHRRHAVTSAAAGPPTAGGRAVPVLAARVNGVAGTAPVPEMEERKSHAPA